MMFSSLTDIYNIFLDHPNLVTDSRSISPSCIFLALKGERFNGNHFAADALEKGASLVVVDEPQYKVNTQCLLVEDCLKTLQELAAHHRRQFNIPVIAITGTNGKTTTKELISAVLKKKYNVISTSGNLNNHIGVPLTLLKVNPETQIAVIEMGANHPGEIAFLCRIAAPDHGLITNIGKAHLEGFGGFEGVVRAKTELYLYLSACHGTVFVNSDDTLLMQKSEGLNRLTYGMNENTPTGGTYDDHGNCLSMNIRQLDGTSMFIRSSLFGDYNAVNILASECIGRYFKVSADEIKNAIESYQPSNNRSQIQNTGKNILILDAYNANPSSMEAAIRYFASSTYQNKVVILGDMLELGTESDTLHQQILTLLDGLSFTWVFLVGPVFTRVNAKREFTCFGDSALARLWFSHHGLEGKTVMLKGSRGIALETIAEVL